MRQIHKVKAEYVLLMSIFLVRCRSGRKIQDSQCGRGHRKWCMQKEREKMWKTVKSAKKNSAKSIPLFVVGLKENNGV